jgi:malate/lactate dehydrogenase
MRSFSALVLVVLKFVAYLQGEYGEEDITIGVPAVLGEHGMEKIVELDLNETEQNFFNTSVSTIRKELSTLSDLVNNF